MMVLNINIGKRQTLFLICIYRQWKPFKKMNKPESKMLPEQLEGSDLILNPIKQLFAEGKQLVLMGHLNLNLWPPNDPY